jgi:hypothetical protein
MTGTPATNGGSAAPLPTRRAPFAQILEVGRSKRGHSRLLHHMRMARRTSRILSGVNEPTAELAGVAARRKCLSYSTYRPKELAGWR